MGAIPDKEYYRYKKFSPKEATKFTEWYDRQKERVGYRFVMKDELVTYSIEDVNILRRACIEFKRLFLGLKDVDPFRVQSGVSQMFFETRDHSRDSERGI